MLPSLSINTRSCRVIDALYGTVAGMRRIKLQTLMGLQKEEGRGVEGVGLGLFAL